MRIKYLKVEENISWTISANLAHENNSERDGALLINDITLPKDKGGQSMYLASPNIILKKLNTTKYFERKLSPQRGIER